MSRGQSLTVEDFWSSVTPEPNTGCWLWGRGGGQSMSMPSARVNGVYATVPRHAFMLATGSVIPQGAYVCHRCSLKTCVNPDHLYVGDASTNSRDMWRGYEGSVRRPMSRRGKRPIDPVNPLARYLNRKESPSLRSLASLVGVSHSTLSRYAAGLTRPSVGTAYDLERVTGGAVPVKGWARKESNR